MMRNHRNRPEGNPSEGVGSPNTFITPARNRILSFALAVCLLLTMTLVVPGPVTVSADVGMGNGATGFHDPVDTDGVTSYQKVYFGNEAGSPIEWRVLAVNNDDVFLLKETPLVSKQNYHNNSNNYIGSWIVNVLADPAKIYGTQRELAAIRKQKVWDVNGKGTEDSVDDDTDGHYFYLLSNSEAQENRYFPNGDSDLKIIGSYWWLRSPFSDNSSGALLVRPDGSVNDDNINNSYGVRPAFRLDLSSVLFTSAAAGGKSVTPGSTTLSAAEQPTGAIKLTLEDSGLGLTVTGLSVINAPSGSNVQIPYTGAKTGTGRSVSVVIADSSTGKPLFYGHPVDCSGGNDSGIARFQLPSEADLAQGEYKLLVFNEEVNGDNCTDYASTPEVLTLNVGAPDTTKPTVTGVTPSGAGISIGTSSLSIEFSKEMDTVVTGTVSLNSSATVTGGVWEPDNRTIVYDLAGLDYDKTYTVTISGFQDTSGNVMDAVTDNSHQFTTESAVANPTDLKVGHMEDNSVAEGEDYSKTIPVDYKGSLPLGYSASGLPSGLSVNDSTGLISGQPDTGTSANSPYTVTVKVQEQGGTLSDTRSYTLNVTTTATDPSPVPNSGSRSSGGSSGGSSTPDSRVAKTQLPASAFSWDGGRTLTINHDSITPLGLLSVRWDGATLTRGTDYGVYQGSVIVRFGEDFMDGQSPGDHTVRVEFLNHTGEATVMVDGEPAQTAEANDDLFTGDTHNPNTGGYPDGGMGATDNPNTGDGRRIWLALLLGSLGAAALVIFPLQEQQTKIKEGLK